jgi:hypothetical protein
MGYRTALWAWVRTLHRRLFDRKQQQLAVWEALAAEADQAETQENWQRAAELLAQLQATCPEPARQLRLARCCLLAGQWHAAADAYAEAGSTAPADIYHAGFALAKLQDFVGCLRCWQQLDCAVPAFIAQQEQVKSLLIAALHCRLDAAPLHEEEHVLLLIEEFALTGLPGGAELLAYCRRLRLARLWQEERLEDIAAMAAQTDWLEPAALAIQAKAACQRMATASLVPAEVRQFIDCWLTLLFHPQTGPQDETQQQRLLDYGAELLRKQTAYLADHGAQLLRQWEETLILLQRLRSLTADPVFAPALAVQTSAARQFCAMIRAHREAFPDEAAWLAAGAAYSPAGYALLLAREAKYDAALDALIELEEAERDAFVAWSRAAVRTAYAVRLIQDKQYWKAEQLLTSGPAHWTAELERLLLAVLHLDEDQDGRRLTACLGILALLPYNAQSRAEFCATLTDQAIRLRSNEATPPRLLAAVIDKATALNPEDELAQTISAQIRLDLELAALAQAFDQDSFAEAARIAVGSRFPQTIEQFFTTARQRAARIERGDSPDQEAAIFQLEELLASVSRTDATHGAVRRIRQALDSLRQMRREV